MGATKVGTRCHVPYPTLLQITVAIMHKTTHNFANICQELLS